MSLDRAPYGTWTSPITPDLVTQSGVGLAQPHCDGEWIYWLESRPAEKNRTRIVRIRHDRADGVGERGSAAASAPQDVTIGDMHVRTMVHEYGGGDYCVHRGVIYFSNFDDQRLYRLDTHEGIGHAARAHPITPEPPAPRAWRYADGAVSPDGRWIVCVRERHVQNREPYNELIVVSTSPGKQDAIRVLAEGHDFFAEPRFRADGGALAWISWDHPNMPWDGTDLRMAIFDPESGTVGTPVHVAGGRAESVVQPQWGPDGALYFTSDRSGWANLYRLVPSSGHGLPDPRTAQNVFETEAEFAGPLWMFGNANYALMNDGRIAAVFARDGLDHLGVLVPGQDAGEPMHLRRLAVPFTHYGRSTQLESDGHGQLVCVASSPTRPPHLVAIEVPGPDQVSPDSRSSANAVVPARHRTLRHSTDAHLPDAYFSKPESIEFPTEGGRTAHALFYPPTNPDYRAPDGERPPLIVKSHGGPTSATSAQLDLSLQYWTSRGFAFVDVNYGGSTGYGRAYRQRLNGQWGIVDTMDCINAARYLVKRRDADGQRLIVRGGSAGGYTTLCALVFHDVFAAGASYYGVTDLESLDEETHKFESRYNESLVGPYPEARDLYRERSPARHMHRISCPVIVFQGLEDKVVPPSQAEVVVSALREKGIPHEYVTFADEGHGFRQPENVKTSMEAELAFYRRTLGF